MKILGNNNMIKILFVTTHNYRIIIIIMTKVDLNRTQQEAKAFITIPFAHSLRYEYIGEGGRGLSAGEQIFLIDDVAVPHFHHPLTLHGTKTKKSRPRVQLTEEHSKMLDLYVINERSRESTTIVFPNGRVNYVFIARKNSQCRSLRRLHGHMEAISSELDRFLSRLNKRCLCKDDLGGGRYIVSGFGTMGKNVAKNIRPPNQPALRQSLKFAEHMELSKIVGGILSHIADCFRIHCSEVLTKNQFLLTLLKSMAWPPLQFQGELNQWMSSQYIIRRWGSRTKDDWPGEKSVVALHTDRGDIDSYNFNCYTSGGGIRNKGGPVANSDLAVFQNSTGGAGYRVKTCIEDTVVVVVMNSHNQLHGCIKNEDNIVEESQTWTTRIIPYIPTGVYQWKIRHPDGVPFMDIP